MCRGVFSLSLFLIIASSLISLFSTQLVLEHKQLNTSLTIIEAQELFYLSKNIEWSFQDSLLANNEISARTQLTDWKNYWSKIGVVRYGKYLDETTCLETAISWQAFLEKTITVVGNSTYFTGFGLEKACIFIELEKRNFKTLATIISPECAGSYCF
ncbi:MAG: hypothetical protein GOU99_03790 [Candidatus Altiarchaeota archaeon]|nr:hypothetical protein [Candidatus Altiarchaeota archaeon]